MENMTWIKTDDAQWVKRIDNQNYVVVQIILWGDENHYGVDIQHIDFEEYTTEELYDTLHFFGYEPIDLTDMDGQIMAEMLAEDAVDKQVEFTGTYDECYEWILNYIA